MGIVLHGYFVFHVRHVKPSYHDFATLRFIKCIDLLNNTYKAIKVKLMEYQVLSNKTISIK